MVSERAVSFRFCCAAFGSLSGLAELAGLFDGGSEELDWNLPSRMASAFAGGNVAPGRSSLAFDRRSLDDGRHTFDRGLSYSARRLGPGSTHDLSALLSLGWPTLADAAGKPNHPA